MPIFAHHFVVLCSVPGPVDLFRPINIGDNHVNLEWKPPEENRGDILGYDIGYQSGAFLLLLLWWWWRLLLLFFLHVSYHLLLFFFLSSSFWPRYYNHGCLANAPKMPQESSAGDVLQVPLRSCLHQLQLPAKTTRQQIELEKRKKHLPVRHPVLQDTVQTDVSLPQDHTRL